MRPDLCNDPWTTDPSDLVALTGSGFRRIIMLIITSRGGTLELAVAVILFAFPRFG